jgi:phosphoglucosamine mutase
MEPVMSKLFGTDGIRGVANEYPMTAEMAVNIGKVVALLFKGDSDTSKIVIGKDTRISGDMLEHALVSGICSMGVDAHLAGIIPTPGVAFLTSSTQASAGIVISASHNPYYDNGIKIFNQDGYKLSDEKENEVEQLLLNKDISSVETPAGDFGQVYKIDDAVQRYGDFLKHSVPKKNYLQNLKIVIDCSHGATFVAAPSVFKELGAEVDTLFVTPNGKNINDNCGSEHPNVLKKVVVEKGADVGLAFDGDGDRLIAVDEKGTALTGDQILAICAHFMQRNGRLKQNRVVSTIMSNLGLGKFLQEMNIKHFKTQVGDRYVVEEMIATGAVLGGEDSGHMVFLDRHTTGDGMLTSLKLLEAIKEQSKPLSELAKIMTVFPQTLLNVEVKKKPDLDMVPEIKEVIKSVENNLGDEGRVLVRYSGTQSMCRVMVEGPTAEATHQYCKQIADIIRFKIG